MRKGSTSLGSLGLISSGIALLILPILPCISKAFAPAPAWAGETVLPKSDQSARSDKSDNLQGKREGSGIWLASTNWLRARRHRDGKAEALRIRQVIRTRATWYGPGFHGRRTASGERFNQNAMTLASRHLPFGTRVRVVNLRTGKSAIGRVNDRGPFRRGYTADLSKGLARKIGLGGHGPVRLEILAKR